jgi:hypothetical protein
MPDPTKRRACRYPKCGKAIVYQKTKFRWVHLAHGIDHAPVP